MEIKDLVVELSRDPFNSEINFYLAEEYFKLNQTASAVSFYLRAAEYGEPTSLFVYMALLRVAHCMLNQSNRTTTVVTTLMQAVAFMPERPEAYYLLSKFYEGEGKFMDSYVWAKMGLSRRKPLTNLWIDMGYYGDFCLKFQVAVAGWWLGQKDDSREILLELSKQDLPQIYADAVRSNIENTNALF
jgi:hypothetical protein